MAISDKKTNSNLKKNQRLQYVFFGAVIIIIFIALAFFLLKPGLFSLGSSAPAIPIDEDLERPPEPEEITEIVDLKTIVPYEGTNFSIVFDENEGQFFYYINPSNVEAGNQELDQFLAQNGVPNKESFPGLIQSSIPVPTPAP